MPDQSGHRGPQIFYFCFPLVSSGGIKTNIPHQFSDFFENYFSHNHQKC